jgi:methylmalonyl-CoA mutase N-terminal domain/subunit
VEEALQALSLAAESPRNLMEPLLDCARADCTLGEIVASLQDVFGTYVETPIF